MKRHYRWWLLISLLCYFPGNVMAGAGLEVGTVPTDFNIAAPLERWEQVAGEQAVFHKTLQFGPEQIQVRVFILHNKDQLLLGIIFRDPYFKVNDACLPGFTDGDHLKIYFDLQNKDNHHSESFLILPDSLFGEAIIVPDYSFYLARPACPRSEIIISSELSPDSIFIKMGIPFKALGVKYIDSASFIDFDLAFYKNSQTEAAPSETWLSSNSPLIGNPITATFKGLTKRLNIK